MLGKWQGSLPLSFVVTGGQLVGDVDIGYGPARGFNEAEVDEIADALAEVPIDTLRARLSPIAFTRAEIYPHVDAGRDRFDDEEIEFFLDHIRSLTEFMRRGAAARKALLVWIA